MKVTNALDAVLKFLPLDGSKTKFGVVLVVAGLLLKPDVAVVTQILSLLNSITGEDLTAIGAVVTGTGATHKVVKVRQANTVK